MAADTNAVSIAAPRNQSTAGIYTEQQVAGWKPVVKAVKDKGAAFFCQVGA